MGGAGANWSGQSGGGGGGGSSAWGGITGTLSDQTDLQSALNLKANLASPTFSGTIGTALTVSRVVVTDGSGNLSVSTVTPTTLAFLDATSSVQTQLDGKLSLSGGTMTGNVNFGAHNITNIDTFSMSGNSIINLLTGAQINIGTQGNPGCAYFYGPNLAILGVYGGTSFSVGGAATNTIIYGTPTLSVYCATDNQCDLGDPGFRYKNTYAGGATSCGVHYITPTTGSSVTINDNVSQLIANPAGTLATLTLTMPPNPFNGMVLGIASSQIITGLTLSANSGQTLDGALTTLAANAFAAYRYVTSVTTWFRVG